MDNLIGGLRYAIRQFWVSRIFTAAAVLTLAIGIGGTTAIFTLIHAVMLRSLPVSDPERLYRIGDGDDWPSLIVLAFAFGLALVTGVIFGAAPAWFATRTDPVDALRGAGRSTGDHSSFARKALLIVQATLSVVLVAGATMLGRSLNKLEHQDFGYRVQGRVVVSLNRPPASYTQPKLAALYRELEDRLNRLPGVQGSGLALYNPLTDNWGELILVAGHPDRKST